MKKITTQNHSSEEKKSEFFNLFADLNIGEEISVRDKKGRIMYSLRKQETPTEFNISTKTQIIAIFNLSFCTVIAHFL
jgi:hypothetical protein